MDKVEEIQDTEVEKQDKTPETKTDAPDDKKPTPKKEQKLLSEEEVQTKLRDAGRDAAALKQREDAVKEREDATIKKEIEAKWQDVSKEHGEEVATKYKSKGISPEDAGELLTGVKKEPESPPPDEMPDSNKTTGTSVLTVEAIRKMSPQERVAHRKEIADMPLGIKLES